jgi:hypothetical protein
LIFVSEINEFHYRTQWDKNLLIPLSEVMKLIYPIECGNETHDLTEWGNENSWGNEVLISLKISGINIIYPTGLDKQIKRIIFHFDPFCILPEFHVM